MLLLRAIRLSFHFSAGLWCQLSFLCIETMCIKGADTFQLPPFSGDLGPVCHGCIGNSQLRIFRLLWLVIGFSITHGFNVVGKFNNPALFVCES